MSKGEIISNFLDKLKVLHKKGNAVFTIFCGKCGGKNCQVAFWPTGLLSERTKESAIGLKCLDCGAAGDVPYDVDDSIYG